MTIEQGDAETFLHAEPGIWAAALAALTSRREVELAPDRLVAAAGRSGDDFGYALPDENAVLTALVLGAYNAMSDAAEAAAARVSGQPNLQRWIAICVAVRGWAIEHPDEYMLIWGQPVPGFQAPPETMAAGARTVLALLDVLRHAQAAGALAEPTPAGLPLSPGMRANVDGLAAGLLAGLPDWVIGRMLVAWTQLHGMVGFEVNGHIAGVAADPGAFFDYAAGQLGQFLGLSAQA